MKDDETAAEREYWRRVAQSVPREQFIAILDEEIERLRGIRRQLLAGLRAKGVTQAAPPVKRMVSEPFDEGIRGLKALRRELAATKET